MNHLEQHAHACAEMMEAMGTMTSMMGGMGMMGGGMGMMGGPGALLWALVPLALLALAATAAFAVVRVARRPVAAESGAREVLDARYARGELTREEYLTMRRDVETRD